MCGIDMGILVRIPSECYMAPEDGVGGISARVGRGRDLERKAMRVRSRRYVRSWEVERCVWWPSGEC